MVDTSFLPRFFSLALLLLIVWIFTAGKIKYVQFGFFEIAFVLFYLWNVLSCLWAISPSEAMIQSQLVFLSLALFLVISWFCKNPAFENIFIKTHLVILLFSFGLAFYKMSVLEHFDPYRIISISANNNLYAGFLILSLPLAFTGYSVNRGFWKYLSLLVAILATFFMIIIQSRAAYLGLAFAVVLSSILMVTGYKRVFSKANILTGFISLFLLLGGVVLFYSSLDNTRKSYFLSKIPVWQYLRRYEDARVEKLLKMRNAVKAGNTQMPEFDFSETYYENASLRVIFWKKSACLIKSHPVAGIGAGNWRLVVPSCKEPPNPEHTIRNYTYSQPHNEWISILAELGIVGFLLAVCVFFIPLIFVLHRILFRHARPPLAAVFYAAFILGFYLFASFDFPLKRVEHQVILFTLLALVLYACVAIHAV